MRAVDSAQLTSYLATMPNGSVVCPACGGGVSCEKSFRLYQPDKFGTVRGLCFRASCGYFFTTAAPAANDSINTPPSPSLRPYTGPIYPLPDDEHEWVKKRYGFPAPAIYWDGRDRYVMPVWSPDGVRRGVVLRRPHAGTTLYGGDPTAPKSLTYRERDEPMLAWYPWRKHNWHTVVLVEDQISAMKVRHFGRVTSVALLGTQLSSDKVTELQKHAKRLVIALDADATSLAFKHARRWGQAFQSCRVLVLQKDIKDAETGDWLAALVRIADLDTGSPAPAIGPV